MTAQAHEASNKPPETQTITKLEGKATGHIGGVELCVNTQSHISISKPNVNNNN